MPLANSYLAREELLARELFYPLEYVCGRCFLAQTEEIQSPRAIGPHKRMEWQVCCLDTESGRGVLMIFTQLQLPGIYIIEPEPINDERGFFARSFCRQEFIEHGLNPCIAQCNISFNPYKGTLRGLHYQNAPYPEAKVVTCIRGAIYDVFIDLRQDSPAYLQWGAVILRAPDRRMLYLPEGFAHGFQTLEDDTEVLYRISEFYHPECARGIRWDDPAFLIHWPEVPRRLVSARDKEWSDFMI